VTIANFLEARAKRHLPPVRIAATRLNNDRPRLLQIRDGLMRLGYDKLREAREAKATADAAFEEAARIREHLDFGVHL
jgi:hypothetical protein